MAKIIDLTPKHFPIIPAKEKIELPMSLKDDVDLVPLLGGSRIGASETIRGAGNKILKIGEKGIWLGNANFEDAPFKVSMTGRIKAVNIGTASVIVATATSKAKNGANYVCDGVDDQTEINSAITDLGSVGGTVYLLEGTYIISNSIVLTSNISLVGLGVATIIKLVNSSFSERHLITNQDQTNGNSNIVIENLKLDGNKDNQDAANINHCISLGKVSSTRIRNLLIENSNTGGISFQLDANDNNFIENNIITASRNEGIILSQSKRNTIRGNLISNCGDAGIKIIVSSNENTVLGNFCTSNNVGILLSDSTENTIYGNNLQSNTLQGLTTDQNVNRNLISNNVVFLNGRVGIYIWKGKENLVANNYCHSNSQSSDGGYANIYLVGDATYQANYNIITGNICRKGSQTNKPSYGIALGNTDTVGNMIEGNDLYDSGVTGDLLDSGSGTLKRDNRNLAGTGWLTDV